MFRTLVFASTYFLLCSACSQSVEPNSDSLSPNNTDVRSHIEIDSTGMTIATRYNPPYGFERITAISGSFEQYLRNLQLKPLGEQVHYYNGSVKPMVSVYSSVVDLPIGTKNLHQCADAIMRLRGEYLWRKGEIDRIHFNFTNGFRVDYNKWLDGGRMQVSGNSTYWTMGSPRPNTYETFWKYMELIFNYAGTLSLEKELQPRALSEIQIGDVFIQGGSPGHAVIVVDICVNLSSGEKRALLAQSYMPAQEIQVLRNPREEQSSWFNVTDIPALNTPEWTFYPKDLKKFE